MHHPIFIAMVGLGILIIAIGIWASRRHSKSSSSFDQAISKAGSAVSEKKVPEKMGASESHQAKAKRERLKTVLHQPQERERLVCLLAGYEKVIQSPIIGVFISLEKCFEDLGFIHHSTTSLEDLISILKDGIPGVLCVDSKINPDILRDITRLVYQFPGLRKSVFIFYNAEGADAKSPPAVLPNIHFLGSVFASQQVMEILAPSFNFETVSGSETGKDSGAIFEGMVSENALAEILQFLEVGRRTGLLSLETDQPAGVINFEDGEITFAQTHSHEGVEAVFEILSLNQGKFQFFPGTALGAAQPRLCATQVMLLWAQRVDETGEMSARRDSDELLTGRR